MGGSPLMCQCDKSLVWPRTAEHMGFFTQKRGGRGGKERGREGRKAKGLLYFLSSRGLFTPPSLLRGWWRSRCSCSLRCRQHLGGRRPTCSWSEGENWGWIFSMAIIWLIFIRMHHVFETLDLCKSVRCSWMIVLTISASECVKYKTSLTKTWSSAVILPLPWRICRTEWSGAPRGWRERTDRTSQTMNWTCAVKF